MNWYARSAWIYKDSAPDYPTLKKYGIALVYIDPRSSNAAAVIADLHAHGFGYGVYFDPGWYSWPPTLQCARIASGHLKRLGLNAANMPVMFDLETKDTAWVRRFLLAWRVFRPTRATAYTNAPFQGGFVPSGTLRLLKAHVYIQVYRGDMSEVDAGAALLEIARQGTPADQLHPFYDGKTLPSDARDGCVFTAERLPT